MADNPLARFFSREAGQQRRRALNALDQRIGDALGYYLGPQLAPRVGQAANALAMFSPGMDVQEAVQASGEMMAPNRTPLDRAASGAALAGALGAMFMPGGVSSIRQGVEDVADAAVRAYDPNTTNIFAGRLAKTADLDALAQAEEMAASGASRDDIWRNTGWFQGVDGKWRFEIDDSGAGLTDYARGAILDNRERSGRVGDILDHRALSEAYPDVFGEITVDNSAFSSGGYYPDTGAISVRGPNVSEAKSTLLHELQHGIQGYEGFASGSSPGSMFVAHMELGRRASENLDAATLLREVESNGGDWGKAVSDFDEIGMPMSEDVQRLARTFGRSEVAQRAFEEIADARKKMEPMRRPGQWQDDAGFGPYFRTAGEVEARNVQARRDFSKEQRASTPPWETQSVADDAQLIVRGDRLQLAWPLAGGAALGAGALAMQPGEAQAMPPEASFLEKYLP